MFRFIMFALLALNFVVSSHRRHGHSNHHRRHHGRPYEHDTEKVFRDTVSSLTKIDRRLQQFCSQHSAQGTGALFEASGYSLLVPLAGFQVQQINVVRRHRVVLIRAERQEDNDTLFFSDVRILPEMVDFPKGVWDFQAERLKIFFPYKSQDNEWCSERIDDKKSKIPFVSAKDDYRDILTAEKDHRGIIGVENNHKGVVGVDEDHQDVVAVEEFTVQFSDYM